MSLNEYFLGTVSVLYLIAGIGYYKSGQTGLSLAFICYGISNVGLIIASLQGRTP